MSRLSGPRSWLTVALVLALLACAYAVVAQETGCAQKSHYALIQALSSGTAEVDARKIEYCDVSYWHGRYYTNKGPGLAFLALPFYTALDTAGILPDEELRAVWALNLWTVIIPALLLLLLVARAAEWVAPGSGPLAAVALGAGTLVLPFATLFFSHVTAAALGFAGFMLLCRERRGPPRTVAVLAAGALIGFSGTVEYPMAIFALVLGVYAISRAPRLRRGLAFTAGAMAGILPLLLYNQWAFGSFSHLSYRAVVLVPGKTGHDVLGAHAKGFFAISTPSIHTLVSFLVEERGMLVLTPVVAVGVAGLWLLRRSPWRAEAYVGLALCLLFVLYNAGFDPPNGGPFGGSTPGPRFLIAILPFVAFPIGLAYRRAPGVVVGLLAVSVVNMASATAADPMIEAGQGIPWRWMIRGGDVQETVAGWLGAGRVAGMAPFFVAIGLAAVIGVLSARTLVRPGLADVAAGLAGIAAWLVVCFAARPAHASGNDVVALAVVATSVAVAIAAARTARPAGAAGQTLSETAASSPPMRATSASSSASR